MKHKHEALIKDLEKALRDCVAALGAELNQSSAEDIKEHPMLAHHQRVYEAALRVLEQSR